MPHLIMLSSINQYTEPPIDMPNQPIPEPQAEKPKQESKGISKYIYLAIGLIILAIIVYFLFFSGSGQTNTNNPIDNGEGNDNLSNNNEPTNTTPDLSKNGICDHQENCFDNPSECRCKDNEYCSDVTKACTETSCGNKVCETDGGESEQTCCLDCTCTIPGQMCNAQTKACEVAKMNLTSDRAIEVLKAYFEASSQAVNSTEALGVYEFNQTLVQRVKVRLGDEPFSRQFGVTESEEVIDFHTI